MDHLAKVLVIRLQNDSRFKTYFLQITDRFFFLPERLTTQKPQVNGEALDRKAHSQQCVEVSSKEIHTPNTLVSNASLLQGIDLQVESSILKVPPLLCYKIPYHMCFMLWLLFLIYRYVFMWLCMYTRGQVHVQAIKRCLICQGWSYRQLWDSGCAYRKPNSGPW